MRRAYVLLFIYHNHVFKTHRIEITKNFINICYIKYTLHVALRRMQRIPTTEVQLQYLQHVTIIKLNMTARSRC